MQTQWLDEIKARQGAGEIAFVKGSLLTHPLPNQVAFYLSTGFFKGKYYSEGLKAALKDVEDAKKAVGWRRNSSWVDFER